MIEYRWALGQYNSQRAHAAVRLWNLHSPHRRRKVGGPPTRVFSGADWTGFGPLLANDRRPEVAFQPSVTLFLQSEQGVFRGFAWCQPMSINHLLPERVSFEPEEVKVLLTAFDAALRELGLARSDPAALSVAKRIMAMRGEVSVTLPDCERMPSRACGNS